jgi:hypothetical protein
MSGNLAQIMKLASIGIWPWSIAVVWLLAQLIYKRMNKAKPELILLGISFIVTIAVAVLAHESGSSKGRTTVLMTGNVTQQGAQNSAGTIGNTNQSLSPCDGSAMRKK